MIQVNCLILDLSMCNGCRNCQIACKDEHVDNQWPPYALSQPETGQFWMKVNQKDRGTVPKVRVSYLPVPCMHCANPPCEKAATGGAVYTRSDGIVIIDPVKSVGQKQLVAACPYGAIFWNESLNIPQKCTMCAHLLDAAATATDPGLKVPRCVDACPTEALKFGDDTDPAVRALIGNAEVLHPEFGTKPRVYYLNLPKMFLTGALADPVADECIEGAVVNATDLQTGNTYSTVSDNFGDFWFENLVGKRSYELNITKSGFMSKKMVVFLDDDKNVGDIMLYAGGS